MHSSPTNSSGRLDAFLQRQVLQQRIQDELSRRTVVNFFQMLRDRLAFKAEMAKKHSARMTFVPQLDVPDIFIEDEDEHKKKANSPDMSTSSSPAGDVGKTRPSLPRISTSNTTGTVLHTSLPADSRLSPVSPSGGAGAFLAAVDAHIQHHSWSGVAADLTAFDSFYGTPLGTSRRSFDTANSRNSQDNPFNFEVQETSAADRGTGSNRSSRRGSTAVPVSPAQVTEMLDQSVWMDSIRRSTTMRRGSQSEDRWRAAGTGITHPGW